MKNRPPKPDRPQSKVLGVRCTQVAWSKRQQGWIFYWGFHHPIKDKFEGTGTNNEGRARAEAMIQSINVNGYELKEIEAGLQVKRTRFNNVAELIDWYMDIQKGRIKPKKKGVKTSKDTITQKTYDRNRSRADNLKRHLGHKSPALTPADVREYWKLRRQDKRPGSTNTIDHEVNSLLKAAYKQAVAERQIPAEFMPSKFKSEKETIPTRAITQEEHEALAAHCLKMGDQDFADVLTCARETGMRSGDISGLIASQVVFDEIRIVGGRKVTASYFKLAFDTKTGMPRAVPISPALRQVIERRIEGLQDNDLVFSRIIKDERVSWYTNSITRSCEIRAKQAGLLYGSKLMDEHGNRIGFTFHSYKSRMLAELVEKGASEFVIKMILGTVSAEALKHYTHSIDPGVTMRYINGGDIQDKPTYKKPIKNKKQAGKQR